MSTAITSTEYLSFISELLLVVVVVVIVFFLCEPHHCLIHLSAEDHRATMRSLPSLQAQKPSTCEQEMWFWQEQDEVQLVP